MGDEHGGCSDSPLVSVVMSVFNARDMVREAVLSVVAQDYPNWELIAVDDGSTDGTLEELMAFTDPRIRVVPLEENVGLSAALNVGIDIARGEFIARFDADDVCLPERLGYQVRYMREHPEVGISGAAMTGFGDGLDDFPVTVPVGSNVGYLLLRECVLKHPTVILRRSLLNQHGLRYDPTLRNAQDYDLWVRSSVHCQIGNLPDALVRYRVHPTQQTEQHRNRQRAIALSAQWAMLTHADSLPRYGATQMLIGFMYFLRHGLAWVIHSVARN
jgi:glycosyltransferase involved in cell wall biosynthesis